MPAALDNRGSGVWITGSRPSVVDRGVVCLLALAASAGPESVTRAMGAAKLAQHQATIASADQTPLPRLSSAAGTCFAC